MRRPVESALSFFITPVTVLLNLSRRGRFARLGPPQRDAATAAAMPPPMTPGRPLFQRPAIIGLVVPVIALIALVVTATSSSAEAQLGKCVNVTAVGSGGEGDANVVDCGSEHVGRVSAVEDDEEQCPADIVGWVSWDDKVLCVVDDVPRQG